MRRGCPQLQCSIIAVLALTAPAAWAQLEITSSPNPVGSGARALGMGGAFIAIADDATAASWNPGGLTQIERPEVSVVYSFRQFDEEFNSTSHPEVISDHQVKLSDINYLSVVYPIPRTFGGRNLVLSLNYQSKLDFGRNLDLTFANPPTTVDIGGNTFIVDRSIDLDYRQNGSLAALSPAIGFEIMDWISVGAVVNIWDQNIVSDNTWSSRNHQVIEGVSTPPDPAFLDTAFDAELVQEKRFDDFDGINYTFGILVKPTERLTLGAVYHTEFDADVKLTESGMLTTASGTQISPPSVRDLEYTFPSAWGVGAAYRFPNDKLTISMDATRRDWGSFEIFDPALRSPGYDPTLPYAPGNDSGDRSGVSSEHPSFANIDPTWTVRFGAEYVFVKKDRPVQDYLPSLRAGVFYDPDPAGGRSEDPANPGQLEKGGDGDPDDYYGVSIGAGLLVKNRINFDVAYIYRWGNDVRNDTLAQPGITLDVEQHFLYLSTVIYF